MGALQKATHQHAACLNYPTDRGLGQNEFDRGVSLVVSCLEDVRIWEHPAEVAGCVASAIDCFQPLRSHFRASAVLSSAQRAALLEGLAAARERVEAYVEEESRPLIIDGIQAFNMLVVHFAKPVGHRLSPADRVSDLNDYLALGGHAASIIFVRACIEERAEQRALPTLGYGEGP